MAAPMGAPRISDVARVAGSDGTRAIAGESASEWEPAWSLQSAKVLIFNLAREGVLKRDARIAACDVIDAAV